jgi:predicted Zn-dependent protease with MMP-like domain
VPIRRRGSQFRRLRHRRVPLPAFDDSPPTGFERLVEHALDGLPAHVSSLLENVAVVIEDEPSPQQLQTGGSAPADSLYGLYEGTPAVEYGADWAAFPNKISLFRLPLEEDFPDPAELAEQVRRTVVHELAHHAGISDERLERYGLD